MTTSVVHADREDLTVTQAQVVPDPATDGHHVRESKIPFVTTHVGIRAGLNWDGRPFSAQVLSRNDQNVAHGLPEKFFSYHLGGDT